jgi:hypothetical protein
MNRSGRTRTAPSLAICRVAQPGAARVVAVAVEAADPHRVERDIRPRSEPPGRFAPGLALLAGDQQEPPRRDEVLDRAAAAVLVVDPAVRQRGTRAGGCRRSGPPPVDAALAEDLVVRPGYDLAGEGHPHRAVALGAQIRGLLRWAPGMPVSR